MSELLTASETIQKFGLKFNPRFDCFNNGLVNSVRINLGDQLSPFPRIYNLMSHAYVVWNDCVLNDGVTSAPLTFPNYSLEQILGSGKDWTKTILETTVAIYFQAQKERHFMGQKEALESSFPASKLNQALACIKNAYDRLDSR